MSFYYCITVLNFVVPYCTLYIVPYMRKEIVIHYILCVPIKGITQIGNYNLSPSITTTKFLRLSLHYIIILHVYVYRKSIRLHLVS